MISVYVFFVVVLELLSRFFLFFCLQCKGSVSFCFIFCLFFLLQWGLTTSPNMKNGLIRL